MCDLHVAARHVDWCHSPMIFDILQEAGIAGSLN